ncbi:MAG: hypothetical protein ACI4EF_09695 [Coprococcus sp.]
MNKHRLKYIIPFIVGILITLAGILIYHKYKVSNHTANEQTDYMGTAIIDGFAIQIPDKYMAVVSDSVGLSYMDDGDFEMGISVVSENYDTILNSKDSMDSDLKSWADLKQDFIEIAIDGDCYLYCIYEDEGETLMLAYKAADDTASFEIFIRCLEIDAMLFQTKEELIQTCESYLLIADSLLHNAQPTTAENTVSGTTYISDEMYSGLEMVIPDEFEPEDSLCDASDNQLISYQIEDDFYRIASETKPDKYSMKVYKDNVRNIKVTTIVSTQNNKDDAMTLMQKGSELWTNGESQIQSIDINGYTIYYYTYTKDYAAMDETYQMYYLEAACLMKNGFIYRVSVFSDECADVLDINHFHKFLSIAENAH